MRSIVTVTEEADSTRLATVDQLRAEMAEAATDLEDDRLEDLLDQASDAIARFCNRTFGVETLTQTLRLDECLETLVLGRPQVREITSVTEDDVAVDDDDYELDPKAGLLYRLDDDCPVSWEASKIVVVFTAGWNLPDDANTDLPAAVTRACCLLAASYANGQGRDPFVKQESVEGVGSQSLYVPGAGQPWLPPEVALLLVQGGFVADTGSGG